MKYRIIFSVTSKSAMTPSFSGRTADMWPGVRPTIRLASWPTARMWPVFWFMATTEGSFRTTPRPRTDTPGVIDQYLIRTTSDTTGTVNKARSSVAEGLIDLDVVEATSIGQIEEKTSLPIALPSDE